LAAPSPQPPAPTLVLVGPTGVGKTAVAVALAALTPITVISADARQVYRGLDIGTAKPDRETQARVPHRGLDLVAPGERYSAGRFARDAAGWIAETRSAGRGVEPIVVGGTGLYIRALAEGSVAVIHGNSLQANAAAGLEHSRGDSAASCKSRLPNQHWHRVLACEAGQRSSNYTELSQSN